MSTTDLPTQTTTPRSTPTLRPRTDILEDPDGLRLVLDLPGVPQDRCEVNLENGVLEIVADTGEPTTSRAVRFQEARAGTYRRAFQLPEDIDVDGIQARLEHGILTVKLPKAPTAQPRRIDVQVQG